MAFSRHFWIRTWQVFYCGYHGYWRAPELSGPFYYPMPTPLWRTSSWAMQRTFCFLQMNLENILTSVVGNIRESPAPSCNPSKSSLPMEPTQNSFVFELPWSCHISSPRIYLITSTCMIISHPYFLLVKNNSFKWLFASSWFPKILRVADHAWHPRIVRMRQASLCGKAGTALLKPFPLNVWHPH